MGKKYIGIIIFLCFFTLTANSQENKFPYFGHRVTLGNYNSFWEDDIGVIEAGYDFIFNFPFYFIII